MTQSGSKLSSTSKIKKHNTKSDLKLELTRDQKQDLLEAFNLLDIDGTGLVKMREVKLTLRALGFEPTAADIRQLTSEYDPENKGYIDFGCFLDILSAKMVEKDNKADLTKTFKLFDEEDSGKITLASLKRAATIIGENITDEELQEMLDEADKNGTGEISEQEFIRIMRKTNIF